jgi:predicted TIM-barrel fold metal-dependent hydrolase
MTARGSAIDADGHIVESAARFVEFGWSGGDTGNPAVEMMLRRSDEVMRSALCSDASPWDPDARLRDMDQEGIEISINYPTALLLVNQLEQPIAAELCRTYNDWAYGVFGEPTEQRVRTMALVSLADADEAVREARRAVTELSAPGIAVSPFCGHRHLDDPALEPLWSLAEALDVAIGIHGGRNTTAPLLPPDSFRDQKRYYAMSHPFGQMMAMGDLSIGGVLARHPQLRVVFLESGIGWVRWYADRLDEGWESVRTQPGEPEDKTELPPTEYLFSGNCYFSCEPDEPDLPHLVRSVGEDRVVFASDYPHFDCKFPHSVDAIVGAGLGDDLLTKVLRDNPERLYRL